MLGTVIPKTFQIPSVKKIQHIVTELSLSKMAVVCCVLLRSVCSSLHTILTNLPLHKSYTAHILPRKIQLRIGKKRYNPEEERVRLLSSFE